MSLKRSATLTMAVPPEVMDVMLPLLDRCREDGVRTSKRQAIGLDGMALAIMTDFALKYGDDTGKAAASIARSVDKVMNLPSVKSAGGVGRKLIESRKQALVKLEVVQAAMATKAQGVTP